MAPVAMRAQAQGRGKEERLGQERGAFVGETLDGFLIQVAHLGSHVDLQLELVKLPHIGEEEPQEGQGRQPLAHRADHVRRVALQQGQTTLGETTHTHYEKTTHTNTVVVCHLQSYLIIYLLEAYSPGNRTGSPQGFSLN